MTGSLLHVASPFEIIARTGSVYLFLLVALRLTGKRQLGQMTLFDLVVILVISNAVQNAMVGPDTSLGGGLLAASVLLVLNFVVSWARSRSPSLSHWIGGLPTVIIKDGRFEANAMKRENVTEDEVLMAMREHGVDDVAQVHLAVLETDGSISIVSTGPETTRRRRHVRFVKHGS